MEGYALLEICRRENSNPIIYRWFRKIEINGHPLSILTLK
jgi:hypothetical protein